MAIQKVGIVAECISDLPKDFVREHNIGIVYFLVETDSGVFADTDEITAENLLAYIQAGGRKALSQPPPSEDYVEVINKALKGYDHILFISAGDGISTSFKKATEAKSRMGESGKRVHVFDSKMISSGTAFVVIKAVEMAEDGASVDEIVQELTQYRERISATLMIEDLGYLYRNGRISPTIKRLCKAFNLHPILEMRNGRLTIKSIMIGDFEKACLRYVRKELKKPESIDKNRIFLTVTAITSSKSDMLKAEIMKACNPKMVVVNKASATISCNCGPNAFGVMYVR